MFLRWESGVGERHKGRWIHHGASGLDLLSYPLGGIATSARGPVSEPLKCGPGDIIA